MASIDIRSKVQEEITEIVFAEALDCEGPIRRTYFTIVP